MKFAIAVALWSVGASAQAGQENAQPITLRPAGSEGIFDPSLADTPQGRRAWMSFSSIDPSPRWPTKNTRTVTTRLAYSDDRGATWTDPGWIINGISETATGSKAQTWNNEVSSLVYDPFAPQTERWKLFWHHYLYINEKGDFANGWIAYKEASTPQGLRDAREVKLFTARGYNPVNDKLFGSTGSPLAASPLVRLNELSKDLTLCVAPSEPSAIATASGLYLSLSCYQPKGIPFLAMLTGSAEPVVGLLKCDAPCNPARVGAWRYVATLLRPSDAQAGGGDHYSASDLLAQGDSFYLIASPVSNKPWNGSYNGCDVFRFTDIKAGKLESEGRHPKIVQRIQGDAGSFHGACSYAQAVSAAGFVYGQVRFGAGRPYFQIYQTGAGIGSQ